MTSQNRPPKFAQWLISIFCRSEYIEDLIGDLDEEYFHNIKSISKAKSNWLYYKDVISLILSYALVKRKKDYSLHAYSITQNNIAMLKNYIKVATRSLRKQPLFTVINTLGLAAGMSIGILFISMISFIQTYDNFHAKGANIYRVVTDTDDKVDTKNWASAPIPLAQILKDNYSGFGEIVKINNTLKAEGEFNNKKLPFRGLFVGDNFLEVFSFELLSGENDLKDPSSVLITETYAKKLFSEQNPIGQVIGMGELGQFTVKGVLKDVPKNSHIWFEVLLPHQIFLSIVNDDKIGANPKAWTEFYNNYIYLLLPDKSNIASLNNILHEVATDKYKSIDVFDATFKLQQLSDIAMGSDTSNEIGTSWGIEIYLISISITLLILLPACFNYTNISTARALTRAKEIGLRKVVGGVKKQIFLQFILETIIISLISLVGAYIIFTAVRSEFQQMLVAGTTSLDFSITPINLIYSILFAIATGFLAGIFPALHFSNIKPIAALRKTTKSQRFGKLNFQKSLVVIQFALSFGFIMGVVVFVDQYTTTINYDLGFSQENILDIELQGTDPDLFRTQLNQLASVKKVSMSSSLLGVNAGETIWVPIKDDSTLVAQLYVDHNYLDNLELELLAGKSFESSVSSNEQFILVNEKFINDYGYENADEAIGNTVKVNDSTELVIVGVMKDFHFKNLSRKIEPLIFRYNKEKLNYANVKIISNDVTQTITDIENEWKKISSLKMEAKFFSDEVENAFDVYTNVVKIFLFLGLLAITISCLGLLSMVVFNTQNRMKEIGVRKVMGAPVMDITFLLTKDYFKLMLIGSAISIPISYMLFSVMIAQQNAYSTGIGVFPVLISLFILLALGIITVMSETWRAATSNPADTLRYE